LRGASAAAVVGQEYAVAVDAEAALPISHLPVALQFDPEVFEVVRVEGGGFLGTGEQAKVLSDFSRPGELLLGASRLGALPGVTGRGEVARVVLRAKKEGPTTLSWSVVRALDATLKDVSGRVAGVPLRVNVRGERPGHEKPRDQGAAHEG
jgi:hypothetical protein